MVSFNPYVGILLFHDLYDWTFMDNRLLADYLVTEVGATTVYVADL
jgi:hypothetical protein